MKVKIKVKLLSYARLFVTPWTTAYQAPLFMGFSRQEYWSGVPLPSPPDRPMNQRGKVLRQARDFNLGASRLRNGRLASQNNDLIRVWMPGSFIDQSERSNEDSNQKGNREEDAVGK